MLLGRGRRAHAPRCERYRSGVPDGEYVVRGTVETFSQGTSYAYCRLKALSFDGVSSDGKLALYLTGESDVRPGDVVEVNASVERLGLPVGNENAADLANDVRYGARASAAEIVGKEGLLLQLNAAVYDLFDENMMRDEASIAYALLTGNSSAMDEGLSTAVRQGGIAHIFAVSGLHIGIVYSAVLLACKPLKKYSCLPALALAFGYCALCAFTVSSVRALIMCAVLSVRRLLGRKNDLLSSLSVAALVVLLVSPAQYLTAGFLLSFGAVLGLALFSHSFSYAFTKIRMPAFLASYLGAALSVQLVTAPVLIELFGYVSVWALLFNFVLLPCLPVFLLALVLCTLFALITTWAGILAVPSGMIAVLLYVLSVADFSFVVTGFALGAGGAVAAVGIVLLTQRVNFKRRFKAITAGVLCLLFTVAVVAENCVFSGGKVIVRSYLSGSLVFVKTPHENVLVIEGDVSLATCEDFLNRTYGGRLDGVICLNEDEMRAINTAAFLPTEAVYAMEYIPTGLTKTNLVFAEEAEIGAVKLRFVARGKAFLFLEGVVVELDCTAEGGALAGDLFLGDASGTYYLRDGTVWRR